MTSRRVHHAVAVLVAWHALAMLVSSLPSPGRGVDRTYWKDPTVQAEFSAWARMLGVESGPLQDQVYDAAVAVQRAESMVQAPFRPWLKWTNTRQSWKMFVAPHRYPTRMELAVSEGGSWEVVYEEGSELATWHAERFSNERMRANVFAWGWPENDRRWSAACQAFAGELFAERIEAEKVRCRFSKVRSPSASEVLAGDEAEPKWVLTHVVARKTP